MHVGIRLWDNLERYQIVQARANVVPDLAVGSSKQVAQVGHAFDNIRLVSEFVRSLFFKERVLEEAQERGYAWKVFVIGFGFVGEHVEELDDSDNIFQGLWKAKCFV